jgi:hypothetical protein
MIRFVISVLVLALLVWAAVTVPLGNRTFWGHIKAIAGSEEGKDLVEGVKDRAREALDKDGKDRAREIELKEDDGLTSEERDVLRKLIKKKLEEEQRRKAVQQGGGR